MDRHPTVGVVDESPLIISGLQAMLEPLLPGLRLVTAAPGADSTGPVDVTLYDPALGAGSPARLAALLADPQRGHVLAFSFDPSAADGYAWLAHGCAGVLDKAAPADVMVRTIVSLVERHGPEPSSLPSPDAHRTLDVWPGQEQGLSRREAELIILITYGLTNAEIGVHAHLSVNTVKTYVRSAYYKLEVTRRAEAVRWGMQHRILVAA